MLIDKFSRKTNLFALGAIACLGMVLFAGGPAEAATRTQVQRWIVEEAELTKVPPSLALAVARVESNFRDDALGPKGERGVMQIMPATARGEFSIPAGRLWDGRLNINLGIRYLERLYNQYGGRWRLALSHYNGGTLKGRGANAVPHSYTRKYVANVMSWRNVFERRNLVAQIKDTVEVANAAQPMDDSLIDYWMFDDPELDKGWRHYVDVAAYWLKPEEERARTVAERRDLAHEPADDADSTQNTAAVDDWSRGGWMEMRPSDRWKRGAERLRRSFRRHIRGRWGRWSLPSFRENAYGASWQEGSTTGHSPTFS